MKLQIEKAVYGGDGLARTPEGRAALVPFTLPTELVDIELSSTSGKPVEATLLGVCQAAPGRVSPRCRHFGVCGGCHYQHAAYPLQLQLKQAILAETLERAGLRDLPPIAVHAGDPWAYRNRIRLRLGNAGPGELLLGYTLRGSGEFLPIAECPIAAPVLWRAAEALQRFAMEDAVAAAFLRGAAEVELSCTNEQTAVQVLLLLRQPMRGDFSAFGAGLRERLPELRGAGAVLSGTRGGKTPRPQAAWGADGLAMHAAGRAFWVSRGGFFQVNRTLVDTLVQLVAAQRSGTLAWDLFAGVGLFARVLAERFAEVVAVEASPISGHDLTQAKAARVRVLPQTALEFLRGAVLQRERPDLVVLDPPRAGLGTEGARLLTTIRPRELVYVSCDPATLGRDLHAMVDSGYNLAELHVVDLFPQTFHLETVAVLQRA